MNALTSIKSGMTFVTTFVKVNKRPILTVIGVGCIGGAVVAACVQAPKAKEAIEVAQDIKAKEAESKGIDETDPEYHITFVERVKIGARYLWLPTVLGFGGTGTLLWLNHITFKDAAKAGEKALEYKAAYNELAKLHNDYIRGVNKVTTEEQQKEIRNEVGEQRVVSNSSDIMAINTGKGDTLFLDELSGQYFRSTEVAVCNAALSFNSDMTNCRLANSYGLEGYGTINEWLEMYLGINPIGMIGDDNGWKVYDGNVFRIHISDRFDTAPNGEPVRVISYECAPMII